MEVKPTQSQQGFTLTELVVIIVLLAIVSVTAATRFSGRQDYELYALQDQTISVVRLVQVNRMQFNGINTNQNFILGTDTITGTQTNCLGSVQACDLPLNQAQQRSDVILSDNYQFRIVANNLQAEFNLLGNPTSASLANGNVAIQISTSDNMSSVWVCINTEGFVFPDDAGCT
ncbi:type II secretion system protein [Vibrio sp. RE86]|uniref:pilus assembly FimT family protein n=1 Tax=Vibrio sp. RE86 TaxID=2607605 RepID=UPI0014937066|nr:type II secretion system protein [Vibrio sp. RE86]NOH80943.1 type II secretion system protein [Vibrio sp. RE86]